MTLNRQKLLEFIDIEVYGKTSRHLRDLEVWILEGAWEGKTYDEIAQIHQYTPQYLQQDIGPHVWKLLSEVFGEPIRKLNCRSVLERRFRQAQSAQSEQGSAIPWPSQDETMSTSVTLSPTPRCDWGDALDVSVFYGRQQELEILSNWLPDASQPINHLPGEALGKRCRMVALLGMGGIGKTTLAIKLAKNLQHQFDVVLWRSLRNATPVEEILDEWLQFLSEQTFLPKPERLDKKLQQLLSYLRQLRCLLILDNFESVLQAEDFGGGYGAEFEGYGQLLRCVGETQHQSCLVLTSREKPAGFAKYEGPALPVRSLSLQGLSQWEGQAIFADKGCTVDSPQALQEVCAHYSGNPLALKIVAAAVQELHGGDIAEILPYLQRSTFEFADINDLLTRQFNRLSPVERQVMNWLAINRNPVTLSDLETDAVWDATNGQFSEALRALGRRSLIERQGKLISLQPVVMEYLTHRLVAEVCAEMLAQKPNLLNQYALLKAQGKDYIRQAQLRFIVEPVIHQLLSALGSTQKIEQLCEEMLAQLRQETPLYASYAGGNLLNLLLTLNADLRGLDCSDLFIWQAYLAGAKLQNVNFTNAHFSKSVFTVVLNAALSVVHSPDGKLLGMGNADNKVRIWQADSYKELLRCEGHMSWVLTVAFSPNSKLLASGSMDKTIKLWDLRTGQCLKTLQGHQGWVWSVAFSPDGQTLISGSNDRTLKRWDVSTGECLKTLQEQDSGVWSVAFSPKGDLLACGRDGHTLELWDVKTWQRTNVLEGHSNWVRSVVFSPNGHILASGSSDSTLKVWEVSTGQCLKTLRGHSSLLNCIAFSPDGQTLASSSSDRTVRLWDVETGQCLKTLQGHAVGVWSVAFHPDGQTLVSGSNDGVLKVWDAQTGQTLRTFQGYCAGVKALDLSPDGRTIASGGDDPSIKLWDIQTGACLQTLQAHLSWLWCVAFSHQTRMLASGGGGDYTINIWDVETGKLMQTLQGHTDLVFAVTFSPDDRILASSSIDGTVKLWNPETGQNFQTLPHSSRVWTVKFSPEGQRLVSGSEDMTVKLWDIQSGNCLHTYHGHTGLVFSIAISPNGQAIASGGDDTTVKIWDLHSGECLKTLEGHQATVRSVVFSADGSLLASSSDDKTVKIWQIQSGQCLQTLQGHTGEVWKVVFTADSLGVVSGSQDETIKVWDLSTGIWRRSLRDQRPYEGMNITGVTGVTEAQKESLRSLGAFDTGAY